MTIKDSSNKENEIEKGKENDIIIVKKQCENCKEFFIGTKKEVQEKLYQHIKTKHLHGLNVDIKPSNEFSNGLKITHPKTEKCKICEAIIPIDGRENFEEHFKSCRIYALFFKKTSKGFECLKCSEKSTEIKKLYDHIKMKHLHQKKCETCKETFIGTQPKMVQEKFYNHMKTTHLNGLNLEIKPTPSDVKDISKNKSLTRKCKFCDEMLLAVSKEQYEKHLECCMKHTEHFKSTEKKYEFQCLLCPEKFLGKFNIYDHIKKNHVNLESNVISLIKKCECCDEMIHAVSKEQFEKHLESCKKYNKYFKNTANKYEFQCILCPESCLGKFNMYRHIKEKHMNSETNANEKDNLKDQNNSKKKSLTKKCESCNEIAHYTSKLAFDKHVKSCKKSKITSKRTTRSQSLLETPETSKATKLLGSVIFSTIHKDFKL